MRMSISNEYVERASEVVLSLVVGFIGISMTQRMMDSPEPSAVHEDFWVHAYRGLKA
jgi:hypothetical protein